MSRFGKILIIMIVAIMLGACSVKSADDGSASTSDGDPVAIDNPFEGGGDEDDDIIISEGGSSGGSSSPAPSAPEYDPLEIETTKFEDCYQNLNYYQKLKGKGGSENYEWTVSGLPDGISGSKYVSGTTTAPDGIYNITVTLTDAETGGSVSKGFPLKVIEFIREDIKIRVSQFVDGDWKVLDKDSDDHIPLAALDAKKRRLKLEVTGVGAYFMKFGDYSGPSYKFPRASRFYWNVKSTGDELSVFVPPAKDGENSREGQTAYLMPWGEKNDLEFQILGMINKGLELEDTEISVRDEFGNEAKVTIDKIDLDQTTFLKCYTSQPEDLKINVPSETKFSIAIFRDPAKDKSAVTDVYAEGGVAPYQWVIGSWEDESQIQYPYVLPGHARASTKIGCDPETTPDCNHATILWQDIKLARAAEPASEVLGELPIKLTDACGTTVETTTNLKIYFPDDKASTAQAYARIGDACNTNAASKLRYKVYIDNTHLATYEWLLDPILCDGDDTEDAIKDAWDDGERYPNTTNIVEPNKMFNLAKRFVMIVEDGGEEDFELMAFRVWFVTENWKAYPDEWIFSMGSGVMDGPDSKGLGLNKHTWKPRYNTIPDEYLFGDDDDDWPF